MIDRIAALKSKIPENGATESEAMAALALAAKLMDKYGITEDDLNRVQFERDMREGSFTQRQKALHPSQKFCGVTIGKFCNIKIWSGYADVKKENIHMFGMRNDIEMAEFLMGLIHDSMDRGWKEFLKSNPADKRVSRHTQYWSFMMGFAERVNTKLEDLIDERNKVYSSSGMDLVDLKMALVEDGMEAMLPGLRFGKSNRRGTKVEGNAYSQGQEAGNKVNLSRPISKQSSNKTRRLS
jgi:hypothetical protein